MGWRAIPPEECPAPRRVSRRVNMLVLSRKIGEEIVIGDNIRVRILEIHGRQVRLGFVAPVSVHIHREELVRDQKPAPEPTSSPPAADVVPG
jgi:carbon storage regulator